MVRSCRTVSFVLTISLASAKRDATDSAGPSAAGPSFRSDLPRIKQHAGTNEQNPLLLQTDEDVQGALNVLMPALDPSQTGRKNFIGTKHIDDPSAADPSFDPSTYPFSASSLIGLRSPGSKKHIRSSKLLGGIHSWAFILVSGTAACSLLVSLLTFCIDFLPFFGSASPSLDPSSADESQKEGRNTYAVTREVVWRYLGFMFLLSFLHKAWGVYIMYGPDGMFSYPSIDRSPWFQFWGVNENVIFFSAWLGVVLSLAMLFWQCKSAFIVLGIFVLEVSFVNWSRSPHIQEIMKCEYAFLAIALYPIWQRSGKDHEDHEQEDNVASWISKWTSFVALLLLRFNTFRIVFEAGLSKVEKLNSDPCWNDLTCAKIVYNIICPDSPWCFFNYNLPEAFLIGQTIVNHFAELSSIWFVFCNFRYVRHASAIFGIAFQGAIWLTGHFGLINIVTATGFVACFDDAFFKTVACFFSGAWSKREGLQVTEVETTGIQQKQFKKAFSFLHMGVAAAVGIVFLKNGLKSLDIMMHSGFEKYEALDAQWHLGTATYSVFEHHYRRKISTAFEMQHGPGALWTPLSLDCPATEGCGTLFLVRNLGSKPIAAGIVRQGNWSLPGKSDQDKDFMKLAEVPHSMLKNWRMNPAVKHVLERVMQGDVAWASTLGTPLEKIFIHGQAPTAIRWRLVQYRIGTWGHLWKTGKTAMSDNIGAPFGMLEATGPPAKLFVSRWPHYDWLLTVVVWQIFLSAFAALDQKIHGQGPASLFVLLSTLQILPNMLAIPQEWIFEKSAVGVFAIYGFLHVVQRFGWSRKNESPQTETLCSSRAWSYGVLVLSACSFVLVNRCLYVPSAWMNFVGCIAVAVTAMIPREKESKKKWVFLWPREEASHVVALMLTFASVGCCTAMAAHFPAAVSDLSVRHLQS